MTRYWVRIENPDIGLDVIRSPGQTVATSTVRGLGGTTPVRGFSTRAKARRVAEVNRRVLAYAHVNIMEEAAP